MSTLKGTQEVRENLAQPGRLARRLGTTDAVVIGLGSMIGAGIFVVIGPAAQAAGPGLLLGLVIAAFVAYCNATSSGQLAALYPQSGGAYVYGQKRLGALWGFLAGWGFVVGKLASCAAMALTFGTYVAPTLARPFAVTAVVGLTVLNYLGVKKAALATRAIVAFVLTSLMVIVSAVLFGGTADPARLWPLMSSGPYGILQAAGLLFFAFAGYARIATLGEEVTDPARTIPRAIPIALAIALFVYGLVAVSALLVVDAADLARSTAPLARAVEAGRFKILSPAVRIAATVASLGVLLSLLLGVSRTVFAMACNQDLPGFFASVHPRYQVPHRAGVGVGLLVAAIVTFVDVRSAIGFSSFAVLMYYGVTNAAALTLAASERNGSRWRAMAGLTGCTVLALTLPPNSVWWGVGLLVAGAFVFRRDKRARDKG